jgi:hypothetical protein
MYRPPDSFDHQEVLETSMKGMSEEFCLRV